MTIGVQTNLLVDPRTVENGVICALDLRTTARYAAVRPERIDDIADVLDRRHQAARRAGGMT